MGRLAHLLSLLLLTGLANAQAGQAFVAISYHDVRDDVSGDYDPDQYAVSTRNLAAHFRWLSDHGYQPVSIEQIRSARAGKSQLPDKAVLLSFDDGYRSHYEKVYPLLRAFNYPAVFSLVTAWLETPAGAPIQYGNEPKFREDFLSWEQIREMADSGLAEFASHSHDLHKGVFGNPQGNQLPAAVTRIFADGAYESSSAYLTRLREDLEGSIRIMQRRMGVKPHVMTWPYGKYNQSLLDLSFDLGMPVTLTLDAGEATLASLAAIPRELIQANPGPGEFAAMLAIPDRPAVVRAAQVDLDYVYDEDPVQQSRNLSALLDRIRALQISHVFLQAFSDTDADGAAEALYFPNRHMPVRADLFSRVAWQLKTRSEVNVYAWMPVLAFEVPGLSPDLRVSERLESGTRQDPGSEPRLSPFSASARQLIGEIYQDLAVYSSFDGLLFHDDARMNEFEDASAAGVRAMQAMFGAGVKFGDVLADRNRSAAWTRQKSDALTGLTRELAATVRRIRPGIKTARNYFADTVLAPESEAWLAQSLTDGLASYDYVALMAMPQLENRDDSRAFLDQLASRVAATPLGPEKVIFELQSVDWRRNERIDARVLQKQMRRLQSQGIRHLAWYPDDFVVGQPELEPLRQGVSLADYTHRRK
ncbi:MAG: poly-beta-1,6-N-acetyl-D-glucosamine N-deacetylase PgaB [Gammaproteobacteria bacterium]|nr:poly-beta-1,6-N-acetyl-D-glucosamine N-deacetylase PgaB [Gammaproteobacteria bacterium]